MLFCTIVLHQAVSNIYVLNVFASFFLYCAVLLCIQHGMDAEFLWRLSRATYYQSKIEALRDKNRQKKFVYQALEYAGRALKLDENNPNVHKWSVV